MKNITFSEALNLVLEEKLHEDEKVFLLGQDIGNLGGIYGVTKGLINKYPDRVLETPISEQAIMGSAIGTALLGYRPVAELMFGDFLFLAGDLLANYAAKIRFNYSDGTNLPMVVRAHYGLAKDSHGMAHSQNCEGWIMGIPGLKIIVPSNGQDAQGLLISAIEDPDPVVFLEEQSLLPQKFEVSSNLEKIPLGKARICKEGEDVTIITYGEMVHKALEASKSLFKEEIDAEIIDLRTLIPLDTKAVIKSVQKTSHLVVASNAPKFANPLNEVISQVAERGFDLLKAPIGKVGAIFTPIPHSPPIYDKYKANKEDIEKAVKEILK